ncbi:unnamed protein product [Merluccius merluccius]
MGKWLCHVISCDVCSCLYCSASCLLLVSPPLTITLIRHYPSAGAAGGAVAAAAMAGAAGEAEETLTCSLSLLVNLGQVILQNAKQEAGASLEKFVHIKITTMFGLMTAAADFYNSIGVTKKSDAESTWAKSYHEWDSFLASVEDGLRPAETQGLEGSTADRLSGDVALVDARSTECIYRAFGLGSSYAKVLKFSFLLQAAEYKSAGREFPDVPHRLLGDIYQMGGDFVLDEEGKVLLSHPSQHPLDRPAMADILAAMPGK